MSIPVNYAEVPSVSLAQALLNVKFDFTRENLVTQQTHKGPGLDGLLYTRPDGKAVNKPIKTERFVLEYEDIIKFIAKEFDEAKVDWKFKIATLTKSGGLYAEVLFDFDIPSPDNEPISAMAIINSHIAGNPLSIKFGTYRFVCMNGAVVGKTVSHVLIRPKMAQEMLETSLQGQFSRSFSEFEEVGLKYKLLTETALSTSFHEFMESDDTPFTLKKLAILTLEKNSFVKLNGKLKLADLREDPNSTYSIVKDGTKWDLYNALTNASTWMTDTYSARERQYGMISEVMGV